MDLDSVVDELYGLDPAEFTSRRDQRSAEARKEGDRELAAAIKALRRPSAAAYTINLMARSRGGEIDRLVGLGARMREAQAALSGDEMRALGRQRSQLVAGLAQEARRAAREAGHPVSEATEREIQTTFEAALADEAAGEVVRAGRLVKALEHRGMDPVDLKGAVAGSTLKAAQREKSDHDKGGRTDGSDADRAEMERARQAERARAVEKAEQAEEEARAADERRSDLAAALERAKGRRQEGEDQVHRLEEELAEARRDLDTAVDAERRSRRALADAEEEADRAAVAARRARADADAFDP